MWDQAQANRSYKATAKVDRWHLWFQRLRFWLKILQTYRTSNLENADSQLKVNQELTKIIETAFGPGPRGLRLLEIGCGQRASQTILFTANGFDVIGIDLEVPTFRISPGNFFAIVRLNGWERALKSALRHWLFDGQFYRRLSSQYGKPLPFNRVEVRLMNATHLEFPDDYFDFIFSSLVFEHIDNVSAAAQEVNRVLKPQGRARINVNPFPSLSGGHQAEWTNCRSPSDTRIPPWDHLLDNKYPAETYLNKLSWADYQKIFQDYLEVLEEQTLLEPARLSNTLTPELEKTLLAKGYTRKDLFAREVTFLCRKKSGG